MRFYAYLSIALAPFAANAGYLSPVTAQEMGEGEARITATADVRMVLESGPGTNATQLSLLGGVVGGRIGDVRRCYRERTEQAPAVRGRLRLLVALEPGGAHIEVQRDEVGDPALVQCALRAFRGADLASLRPPGAAFVVLDFDNSAAEGVERTQALRAVEDTAEVTTNTEGRAEASGGTPDGLVRFRVVGDRDAAVQIQTVQIQAVHRAVRAAIPLLLDCRRKAGRRESPAGDVHLDLRVAANGRGRAASRRSTVSHAGGSRCVARALGRARYQGEARGRVQVVVTFAADEAATTD